jgi:hypothetical protein
VLYTNKLPKVLAGFTLRVDRPALLSLNHSDILLEFLLGVSIHMSTSALLACLALLCGIANADPAVFTVADPDTAASATVAAGLKSVSVSLSGLGDSVGPQTPPGGTPHANAGSTGGTTAATAELFVADMQPFNVRVGPAADQTTGFDYFIPVIDGAAAFTPTAADVGSRSLFTNVSFTFGAELYAVDATPVSEGPAPSNWEMMILGFVGVGLMPYLVARALLPRPALSAFTVQSK